MSTDSARCVKCGGGFGTKSVYIDGHRYHTNCAVSSYPNHTEADHARLSDEIERLRNNLDLLYAGIADDGLSRLALQTVARNIRDPARPTPEVIAWAEKILRERIKYAVKRSGT